MDIFDQEKLKNLIKSLEDSGTSPQSAERIMKNILVPLLGEAGYKVEAVDSQRDIGIDFIARKEASSELDLEEIAIEYKHFRQSAIGADVVHRVLGAATSAGLSRAMLVTNSRFTFAAREALRRRAPVGIELVDIDALRSWVSRLEQIPSVHVSEINVIRRELSRKFIENIVKDPSFLDGIEWREMERLLTQVFDGLGFQARLTPGSKDGGKDIVLTCQVESKTHTYYVEVKHWRSGQLVGAGNITEFLNVIVDEEVSGGLFLSTYGFRPKAIESLTEIQRKTLRLGAKQKIVSLCKSYVKASTGIWSPEVSNLDMLFNGTI